MYELPVRVTSVSYPLWVWLGSVIVALIAGFLTIHAAERHALRTEVLKLRHRISTRQMNKFHEIADRLRVTVTELPYKPEEEQSFLGVMYPHSPLNVRLYAELATRPDHWDKARSIVQYFHGAIDALRTKLQAVDRDHRTKAHTDEIAECSEASAKSLLYLMRVVDLSSQIRLSPSDPAAQEFDQMLRRWDDAKKALPLLPPEATTGS